MIGCGLEAIALAGIIGLGKTTLDALDNKNIALIVMVYTILFLAGALFIDKMTIDSLKTSNIELQREVVENDKQVQDYRQ